MNKYQKAFNHIVDYGVEVEYFNKQANKPEEESTIMIVSKALDKLETCIELLEKATPKKAIEKHHFNDNLYCPNCESCVYEFYMKREQWCSDCGQKIDWTDTD